MKDYGYSSRRGKNRLKHFILFLGFFVFILGTAYGAYKLFFIPAPVVEGTGEFELLPADKTVTLKGKNLKAIDIFIIQGNKKIELLKDITDSIEKTYTLQIKPKDLNLTDGTATVVVKARSGILKDVKYEVDAIIDTVPPAIEIIKAPSTVYTGSGGIVLLRAKDADSVFIKLIVPVNGQSRENYIFKAFKSPYDTGLELFSTGKQTAETYIAFFPAPFNSNNNSVFYAMATDNVGNQSIRALSTRLKKKLYNTTSIKIDDAFINTVVYPLLNETDGSDPAGAFKKANEEWRKDSLKQLLRIGQKTEPDILWEGRFLQLRNTKVMATYGEKRFYLYNDKQISTSSHLGYDLASTEHAMVEAANSGVIRFADDLGIYGNTVIIDHGLGLMSLYGHLSMIIVKRGQTVEQNEIIGKTGATGLAGGDHLHFGMLIHGYEVSPLYWWDPHWVKVNILDHLEKIKEQEEQDSGEISY